METEKSQSKKGLIIRIVAFSIAIAIAVFAFAYAITSIGKKEEGFQTIPALADADAILYSSNTTFEYYCSGSSNEIKQRVNEISSAYSVSLGRIYKLLDADNTYSGFVNIASINGSLGEAVAVGEELFGILCDAYARTLSRRGFNMFAGALYSEWGAIINLEEPSDFDPISSEYEAERISAIAAATSDLSNFTFTANEQNMTVRLDVSKEYIDMLEKYEISAPVLSLGTMLGAYTLDAVSRDMKSRGFTDGYMYTSDGLFVNLGAESPIYYSILGYEDGAERTLGYLKSTSAGAAGFFRAFPLGGEKYVAYIVDDGDTELFRHMYFNVDTGDFENVIMSVMTYSDKMGAADVCEMNIYLNTLKSADEAERYLRSVCGDGLYAAYTLKSTGGEVKVLPEGAECFDIF